MIFGYISPSVLMPICSDIVPPGHTGDSGPFPIKLTRTRHQRVNPLNAASQVGLAQVRYGVYNRPMPKAELFKRRRQIHSLFVRNSVIPPCGDLVRPNQSRVFSERLHPERFDATT
jgi:hypothetical protein